jgi:hypothetical protein
MAKMPVPTPIYRITHVSNLAGILQQGGVWCDAEVNALGLSSKSIAYDDLKARRAKRRVRNPLGGNVGAGGTLANYVPFYFANRTPMLGAIHQGNTEYKGGQSEIIYLVSSVQTVFSGTTPWCFTDGHAFEALTKYFDTAGDLNHVNWDVIWSWKWRDPNNPDSYRQKQAEFLVHDFFPWEWVEKIGVINTAMQTQVRAIMAQQSHKPPVAVERKWYFDA